MTLSEKFADGSAEQRFWSHADTFGGGYLGRHDMTRPQGDEGGGSTPPVGDPLRAMPDPEVGSVPWPVGPVRRLPRASLPAAWVAALLCLVGGPAVSGANGAILAALRDRGLLEHVGAAGSGGGRRPLWGLTEAGWVAVGRTP
jgi:hypothetical protein